MIKYLMRSNLRVEGFILAHGLRGTSHHSMEDVAGSASQAGAVGM